MTDSAHLILLGGVFDPVHNGHLQVAQAALSALDADGILLLPSGAPPHKRDASVTAAEHRVAMLRLAIANEPSFAIDDREVRREGPSYTATTLAELHAEHPGLHCYFLIGADNAAQIGHWHEAEQILRLCTPIVVPRPGHEASFTAADLPFLTPERVQQLNRLALSMAPNSVSSSAIRRRVRAGASIADLVPPSVAAYIAAHDLYT